MIIKVLLIAASVAFGVLIVRERPSGTHQALLRVAGIAITGLGVVAVLFPGTTVWAAELVGVKRGTDLVLYIFVMTFLFTALATYQRIHRLERTVTLLAREIALTRAGQHPTGEPTQDAGRERA